MAAREALGRDAPACARRAAAEGEPARIAIEGPPPERGLAERAVAQAAQRAEPRARDDRPGGERAPHAAARGREPAREAPDATQLLRAARPGTAARRRRARRRAGARGPRGAAARAARRRARRG